jgi:adenine-specific DNA-methyltransferase
MVKSSKYDSLSREQLIDKILKLEKERYGLVWEDKEEDVAKRCETELPLLKEDCSREIVCDPSLPYNIIIEGDNYHSLYALSFTHKKSVDVIYIDPPYNTGKKKEWKYNDHWVDENDTYRHSKWLSFMSKRLILARRLLKNEGVIFISIDDHEFAQLKLLCDNIFGNSNFLGEIIWETATDNNATQISIEHEYILCYARNSKAQKEWQIKSEKAEIIQEKYLELKKIHQSDINTIQKLLRAWINSMKKSNEIDLSGVSHYNYVDEKGVFYPGNSSNTVYGDYIYDIIHPKTGKVCRKPEKGYRWPATTFWEAEKRGDVLWGKDETTIPKIKKRIETATELLKSYYYEDNRKATAELTAMMGKKVFNNPKSVRLLKKLFQFTTTNNSIILDFFAGSGSTGQAVMELNRDLGGNRKFILCTNNENNICTEVTYPRIKKVIDGYSDVLGIPANVKYLTQTFVPVITSDNDKRELVNRSTEILCVAEDCFEKVRTRKKNSDFSVFKSVKKQLAIIYDEDSISDCINYLNGHRVEPETTIYVFSYDHTYEEEDFMDLRISFSVKPIPEAIINVYRKISKMKKK